MKESNKKQPKTNTATATSPVMNQKMRTFSKLNNKVIMITGASSGIGHDFCLDLAESGCRIIAAARRTDRLKSLCDQINAHTPEDSGACGVRAVAIELDVMADGRSIDVSVQKGWDAFGRVDALVNNAGLRGNVRSALDTKEEEWDTTMNTNLRGLWLVSKSVSLRMHDAKIGGSIINISSVAAVRGHIPGSSAYSTSKAAVNTLTEVMALELGKYSMRVNSICPGIFKSEITETLLKKEWLKNVAMKTVPLRTYGTTDPALTSLVRYLIHDSSSYVTGNIFIVDAGLTLPGIPIFSSL
ncbi:uncharacterized protein LOC141627854 [Silene latifolia]|uniref:uncharacterized protein LOC141627854 n=1 Tax=Silene latifolia TaxID=37657 RepID=UPI003D775E9B